MFRTTASREGESVFGLSPRGARDANSAGVQTPSLSKPWTDQDDEESCVRELDLSAFQRLRAPSVGPGWERATLETPDPFLAQSPLPRRSKV